MSKIFEFDVRSGSLIDKVSNIQGTLTSDNGGFRKTEKGYALYGDGVNTKVVGSINNVGSNFSNELWFKTNNSLTSSIFTFIQNDGKLNTCYILYDGRIRFYVNGEQWYLNSLNYNNGNWNHLIWIYNDNILTVYINNIFKEVTYSTTISTTSTPNTYYILNSYNAALPFKGYLCKSSLYNHALSETERNKLYSEFLNSYSPVETKTNFEVIKPRDLSYLVDDTLSNDLVTNGGFLAGAAGWTSILNTLDTSNNTGKITNTGTNGKLYQAVNVVSGRKNKINITVLNGTINTYVSTTTDSGGSIISTGNVGQGIYSLEFIPSVDLVYILIYNIGSTGAIGEVDNVYMVDYSGLVASYNMVPSAGGV